MKKIIFLLPLILAACTGITPKADWIQTGPEFASKKEPAAVINSKDEITRPYGFVGVITLNGVAYEKNAVKAAIEKIRKTAGAKGADGVLINQAFDPEAPKEGIIMSGYAFKYVDNLTVEEEAAIEEYRILGPLP